MMITKRITIIIVTAITITFFIIMIMIIILLSLTPQSYSIIINFIIYYSSKKNVIFNTSVPITIQQASPTRTSASPSSKSSGTIVKINLNQPGFTQYSLDPGTRKRPLSNSSSNNSDGEMNTL